MISAHPSNSSRKYKRWIFIYVLLFFGIACSLLFILYVQPSFLQGDSLHIGADSITYLGAANSIDANGGLFSSIPALISFQGQYLGPVFIAKYLVTPLNIAIFNGCIFILGLWYASKLPGIKLGAFFIFLMLNLTTLAAILTLSKEIFAYISIILFVKYIYSAQRSKVMLAVILLLSLAARWEQCAIILLFLAVEHRKSPLKGRHKTVLTLMVGGITVLWPLLLSSGIIELSSLLNTAADAQSQSLPLLNRIQAAYGFPIVLIPKIFGNMFGFTWKTLLTDISGSSLTDIQNQIVSPFQNLAMQLVFIIALWKGKIRISKETIFWISLYVIMTAAGLIFQPRYEYPVYVLLCLEISGLTPLEQPVRVSRSFLANFLRNTKRLPA